MTTRRWNATPRLQVLPVGDSLTKQSFRDLANINCIMARWQKTGEIDHINRNSPLYGDFSGAVDFQTSLAQVEEARQAFDALPSELRARMANDPQNLIEFVQNENNREECEALGLLEAPETATPLVVPIPPTTTETVVEKPPESPEVNPPS